jgi:DNA-binding response OmpR family regulator
MFRSNMILVIEPDAVHEAEIERALVKAGFQVLASQGQNVIGLIEEHPVDLVILNSLLPANSGLETCRLICEKLQTPVILITQAGEDQEIITGLEAGAIDFIVSPVRPEELVARVRATLKRTGSPLTLPGWIVQHGDLLLDLRSRQLVKNGHIIPLTRTEMRLLHFFMRHPGQTLSKDLLLKYVWECQVITRDYNLVDTAIMRLRKSIGDDPKKQIYIQTVWGEGYRFGR